MAEVDFYDRPFLDDFVAPAGATRRQVAEYLGLVVPDQPLPPHLLEAADTLHEREVHLRNSIKAYYDLVLETYGEWSPAEIAMRVMLELKPRREHSGAVQAYERARANYTRSQQVLARRSTSE